MLREREPHIERSPVSFTVNVARLPQKGMPVRIDATEKQRAELAEVHELQQVDSFVANLLVAPWKRNGVKVTGRVQAKIVQSCVVTLEPVENKIDEEIDSVFLPESSKLGREGFGIGGEIVLDAEGPDSPETFSGDLIDVGALAEEFFGLGIDPYPRKQGASIEASEEEDAHEAEEGGSFAEKLREALSKK
ncbi:DUF177 domain-containing protein [Mesorhizobium denitrificans]|uniref:DUF177 domain-containing protein n=2 Tax=Phyllobacteriaceae TaxID=69277 RepID=A0A371X8T7_9HYPH|nr:DUF177 domain-containing protein [Mesorhizobium denitrificans]